MSQHPPVFIDEGNAHVAVRVQRGEIGIVGKELEQLLRDVDQLPFFDHGRARSPLDRILVAENVVVARPEGEGAEAATLGNPLRDPCAARAEGHRQILDEGIEKGGARFGRRSFDDRLERGGLGLEIIR